MGPAYWVVTTVVFGVMAILVLALNYFAHKEYTAEIERLRKDLAASREKNGVYIAQENYTQMIMRLEQQEQEISQLLSHMKVLKEEMDKKEDLCIQLNITLDDCNQKLSCTTNQLEVTRDKLNETSVKLRHTKNSCTEKDHLIEKHMVTEQTLNTQAQSLLAVADMASTDASKLHDKLDRKRSVEDINIEVSRDFHQRFVQNVVHMEDSLSRFTQDLIKFCSGLQSNLGERLEKRSGELASLSSEISSLLDSQTQLIQGLEELTSNQVYNDQKWIQQYLATVRSASDSEVNNGDTFLTDTFLVRMQSLNRQLQLQEAESQALSLVLTEQVQQILDSVKTCITTQSDALSQLKDTFLLHLKQQQQALENSQAASRGMDKSMSDFEESLVTEMQQLKNLADRVLGIHSDFRNHCNEKRNKINNGLAVAREKCDHLSLEASTTPDLQLKRGAQQLGVYESQADEVLDRINRYKETSEQLMTGAKRLEQEIETDVRLAVSNGEKAWRNHYSWTEQELRKYSESVNRELQRKLKQTQNLMSGLRESAESHEALLEHQRTDFGTFVRERQDDLETQCSYVNDWSQTIITELQKRNQDVEKFLIEDLRKDISTGHTPQRREFSYPRILAATSPHERILARFREMNDAVSPPLQTNEIDSMRNDRSSRILDNTDANPMRSLSTTDISSETESVFNISVRSEPASSKEDDDKENSNVANTKRYRSEDAIHKKRQQPAKTPAPRKALQSQN